MFTDADNFAVLFPVDLDVRMKATLLGAVFMIVSIDAIFRRNLSTDFAKNLFNSPDYSPSKILLFHFF